MLTVKAGRIKRKLLSKGFYSITSVETFKDEIINLEKGDMAEIVGNWGPHDMYREVKLLKTGEIITLTDKEIDILFKKV